VLHKKSARREPDAVLHLWEFENAPARLRRHVPVAYSGGWLAFICPGSADDLVENLVTRWSSSESPVVRCEIEDGGIILAGPHPAVFSS
jgi:hypothetical protein